MIGGWQTGQLAEQARSGARKFKGQVVKDGTAFTVRKGKLVLAFGTKAVEVKKLSLAGKAKLTDNRELASQSGRGKRL